MGVRKFEVDVFWSFRSPYCYFSIDRLLRMRSELDVIVNVRPVYPMAVRNPNFFQDVNPKYRKYHTLDCLRIAERLGIPFRRPVPDPIVQDLDTSEIANDQPFIRELTRLGAAAQNAAKGLDFVDKSMRLLWDGTVDNWHQGDHLASAIEAAGLDGAALIESVRGSPDVYERIIADNQAAHDACDHWGVPAFVFDGETFYGQDRIDLLLWRMQQAGLNSTR